MSEPSLVPAFDGVSDEGLASSTSIDVREFETLRFLGGRLCSFSSALTFGSDTRRCDFSESVADGAYTRRRSVRDEEVY